MQPQIQQSKTLKRLCKGSDCFGYHELTLFCWLFVDYRYEEQTRPKLGKTVKSHCATWKSDTLDRGVGVPMFRWHGGYHFYGSRPWRSDYECARRRALAIAKPTSDGLLTTSEHDQPDHEGLFPTSKRRTSKKLRLQSGYCEYKRKALLLKVGFYDVLVLSLNTNKGRKLQLWRTLIKTNPSLNGALRVVFVWRERGFRPPLARWD